MPGLTGSRGSVRPPGSRKRRRSIRVAPIGPSPDTRDAGGGGKTGRSRHPLRTWMRQAKRGNKRAGKNLQRWLRHQGYKITVDGIWGPQTAAAYRASQTGNKYGSNNSSPRPKGDPVNRFNAGPHANKPKKKPKAGNKSTKTTKAINQMVGGGAVGKKLGAGYAGAMAGMQFDAPINDIKVLIERLGPKNAQAIQDVTNWYGQVEAANDQAGARSAQMTQRVAGEHDQAIQGLLASLGGGAVDANAALAQSGLRDSGLLRALGEIEGQYRSDMDPILEHAEASAKTLEQRRNTEQMQNYQLELAQLLGQRGQAKAAAQLEVDKYNNELSQQWFQNKLAKLNANLGAQAAGVDLAAKKQAMAIQKKEAGGGGGGFVPWKRLNPAEKTQLVSAAVYKPSGRTRSLVQAQNYLRSLGYNNSQMLKTLRSYYG